MSEITGAKRETSDVNQAAIFFVAGSLMVGAVILFFTLGVFQKYESDHLTDSGQSSLKEYELPPKLSARGAGMPKLQSRPEDDLRDYLDKGGRLLSTRGDNRIPIDEAIDKLVQGGEKTR